MEACPQKSSADPELVVYGDSELLFAADIMLRSLDRHVAEQELNRIELEP